MSWLRKDLKVSLAALPDGSRNKIELSQRNNSMHRKSPAQLTIMKDEASDSVQFTACSHCS